MLLVYQGPVWLFLKVPLCIILLQFAYLLLPLKKRLGLSITETTISYTGFLNSWSYERGDIIGYRFKDAEKQLTISNMDSSDKISINLSEFENAENLQKFLTHHYVEIGKNIVPKLSIQWPVVGMYLLVGIVFTQQWFRDYYLNINFPILIIANMTVFLLMLIEVYNLFYRGTLSLLYYERFATFNKEFSLSLALLWFGVLFLPKNSIIRAPELSNPLHISDLYVPSIVLFGFIFTTLLFAIKRTKEAQSWIGIFLASLFVFCFGSVALVNENLDFSPPIEEHLMVTEARDTTLILRNDPPDTIIYRIIRVEENSAQVTNPTCSREIANQLQVGDTVVVKHYKGLFDIPWKKSDEIFLIDGEN